MSVTAFTGEELQDLEQKWTVPRFVFFPLSLLGLWLIAHPWPLEHWSVRTFWQVFTSYILFCWTSCFHETAHQTLCRSRRLSLWLGRFLGTVMLVPYTVYRETHIRHHAYLNKPYDWELWPYCDPQTSRAFRRVFVWLDLFFGAATAAILYGRIYFHRDSPLKSSRTRSAIRHEYWAIAFFWGTVLAAVAYYHAWWSLLQVWVVPHMLAGVYQTGRKLTEHLGMVSYDPLLGTRTVMGKNLLTRLCTYVHFDIFVHGPHHRHPRIAHDRLTETMENYMAGNPKTDFPVYATYLQAFTAMLPALFRNPGVGMNVGAPPPGREKQADVEDFLADVSRQVVRPADVAYGQQ